MAEVIETKRIIEADRSLIVGADLKPMKLPGLVNNTREIEGVSAYKLGFRIALSKLSLPVAVEFIHGETTKKVIYDHQKAGNDIDKTGDEFAEVMAEAGVDAAILFPFTGPKVEDRWIKALQAKNIGVIVGSEMTHEGFLESEGGRIADTQLLPIFDQAIGLGVRDFVVPGNKPDRVDFYRRFFDAEVGSGEYALYAPGFIAQGGVISETGAVAGPRFHAIVASAIAGAEDQRAAAEEMAGSL